jgi:hypothetical protein
MATPTPLPIVIVASGGLPVVEAANGKGMPVQQAANGRGLAVTIATNGFGIAVIGSGNAPA